LKNCWIWVAYLFQWEKNGALGNLYMILIKIVFKNKKEIIKLVAKND
jgi:hypothetical protein